VGLSNSTSPQLWSDLFSPDLHAIKLMCVVQLVHHDTLEPVVVVGKETQMCPLVGVTCSSSYKIVLYEGRPPMAVFPWVDLSVRQEGTYKLQFHVYEILGDGTTNHLAEVDSHPFQVFSAKSFPCMEPSTDITETLKKNGIRVRVSKTIRQNRVRATQVRTNFPPFLKILF